LRRAPSRYRIEALATQATPRGCGRNRVVGGQSRSILEALGTFRSSFNAILPLNPRACLNGFLDGPRAQRIISNDWVMGNEVKVGPVLLTAFESEMSFLLSDVQEIIRARSERAFLHLQRLLAVDSDVRDKWRAAFNRGEVSCEKLGAVHLLWHGIFAFKVDAHGAGTDLVFPDEPIQASVAQRGIEGLVWTEWKVVDEGNAASRFDEARNQARLYEQGPLVSSELTGYRYAIAVSLADLPREAVRDDMVIAGIVYRHINIAIEPRRPSEQVRTKSRRSPQSEVSQRGRTRR
jgi:hypothetical protein